MNDIKEYLKTRKQLVEEALARYMYAQEGLLQDHITAMRYSLFAGGKRIRPILCIAAAEAIDGYSESVLPVACALECIHTYSLIHDDLPAMDNDDLRRGKPTSHKKFGEAAAILAGDGLLTYAFDLMSDPQYMVEKDVAKRMQVISIIAKAAGPLGMVGGQALDVESEGKKISFDLLKNIHSRKTGALITGAVQTGAILGNASEKEFAALSSYGLQIGLAFQIVDDLLNVTGTAEELGKATGTDAAMQKATYPAYFGVEETRKLAQKAVDTALFSLKDFDRNADPLRELARYIYKRTS